MQSTASKQSSANRGRNHMRNADNMRAVLLLLAVAQAVAAYRGRAPPQVDDYGDAARALSQLPERSPRPAAAPDIEAMIA